jgi:hypothetical protein
MNAGRDVELLIAGWLEEEAADRAPDRVLESARLTIDRTRQRRERAAWREPVYLSQLRLAGMAAVMAIAVIGAGVIGRATAPGAGAQSGATPSATESGSPAPSSTITIDSFRTARDAICDRYLPLLDPLKTAMDGIYDPELTVAERQPKLDALRQTRIELDRMIGELRGLEVPSGLAVDTAVALAALDSTSRLIAQAIGRLEAGDLAGAEALDLATDPNSREVAAYVRRHGLQNCP